MQYYYLATDKKQTDTLNSFHENWSKNAATALIVLKVQ